MLKLHGRTRSNYYNAVKAVLIEKEIPFEEVIEPVPPTEAFLKLSPMAKIPCLETPQGALSETMVILDYLEATHPENPLCPTDPYERAKLHELMKNMELYIEWAARRGYGTLRGEEVSQADKDGLKKALEQSTVAVSQLTSFTPWVAGDTFTYADIFGYFMMIYAKISAQANADMDLLGAMPGASNWFERMKARPSVQKTREES
ncbi:MAG: glutathione S-transferase family protein [Pseudomonadota bacterium]